MRTVVPVNVDLLPAQAQRVFKGVIFDVYQWQQEMFDGTTETFEMLKRPDTVEVIAIKDDKLVVVHEQQPGTKVCLKVFYSLNKYVLASHTSPHLLRVS